MANSGAKFDFIIDPPIEEAVIDLLGREDTGQRLLRRWLKSMSSWSIQQMLVAVTDEGQRQPGSSRKWKKLSKRYSNLKARLGGLMTMGIGISRKGHQKGKMLMSLKSKEAIELDYSILSMEAGSDIFYSKFFNDGTEVDGTVRMPARPFLPKQKYADDHSEKLFWDLWNYKGAL